MSATGILAQVLAARLISTAGIFARLITASGAECTGTGYARHSLTGIELLRFGTALAPNWGRCVTVEFSFGVSSQRLLRIDIDPVEPAVGDEVVINLDDVSGIQPTHEPSRPVEEPPRIP